MYTAPAVGSNEENGAYLSSVKTNKVMLALVCVVLFDRT
jgi:hypothetical protein